jgi:hypothetical protein
LSAEKQAKEKVSKDNKNSTKNIKELKKAEKTIEELREQVVALEKRPDPTTNSIEWTTTHIIPLAAMAIIIIALLAKDFFGGTVKI